MQNKLSNGSNIRGAIGSIFKALDRQEKVPARRPAWAGAIVLSLLAFLGSVLWYSYPDEAEKREIMAVPIIRADAEPMKIMPNDPGGMDIPYRDSTVFETLQADGSEGSNNIENLLADPEEPVARDQIFAGLKTEIKVEGKVISKNDTGKAEEKPEVVVAKVVMPVPQDKPRVQRSIAEKVSRTEPAAGVETFKSGKYFVQLASLRSDSEAKSIWKSLQKSMSVLRPLGYRVQKADLGARGVYYRVQAGPLSEVRAHRICAAVEAQRPGGCLVTKD